MAALDAHGIDSVHGQFADNKLRASSAFCCKAEDVDRTPSKWQKDRTKSSDT